jgi:hypothetical protein
MKCQSSNGGSYCLLAIYVLSYWFRSPESACPAARRVAPHVQLCRFPLGCCGWGEDLLENTTAGDSTMPIYPTPTVAQRVDSRQSESIIHYGQAEKVVKRRIADINHSHSGLLHLVRTDGRGRIGLGSPHRSRLGTVSFEATLAR